MFSHCFRKVKQLFLISKEIGVFFASTAYFLHLSPTLPPFFAPKCRRTTSPFRHLPSALPDACPPRVSQPLASLAQPFTTYHLPYAIPSPSSARFIRHTSATLCHFSPLSDHPSAARWLSIDNPRPSIRYTFSIHRQPLSPSDAPRSHTYS